MKAVCLKQYAGDIENYGIDFKQFETYPVTNIKHNEIYLTAESGTDVMLSEDELKEFFKTHINGVRVFVEDGNVICYQSDYINTRKYENRSWSEKSFCDWCDKYNVMPV